MQVGDASSVVTVGSGSDAVVPVSATFTLEIVRDGSHSGESLTVVVSSGPGRLTGTTSHTFGTLGLFTVLDLKLDAAGAHVLTVTLTRLDGTTIRTTYSVEVRPLLVVRRGTNMMCRARYRESARMWRYNVSNSHNFTIARRGSQPYTWGLSFVDVQSWNTAGHHLVVLC